MLPFAHCLEVGRTAEVIEQMWTELLQRNHIRCHTEPGLFRFVAQVQIVSNLASDPEISLMDKLRLYDGEAVRCRKTGALLDLANVRNRAAREGQDGIGLQGCLNILHQCALDSLKAAAGARSVLSGIQSYAGFDDPTNAQLGIKLFQNLVREERAHQARLEVLDVLRQVRSGGASASDLIAALSSPEDQETVLACVTKKSVHHAFIEAKVLRERDETFIFKELEPIRRTDARAKLVRAIEPGFDDACERAFESYLQAAFPESIDLTRGYRSPDLRLKRELEQRMKLAADLAPSFHAHVVRELQKASAAQKPRYRVVPELGTAIEGLVEDRIATAITGGVGTSSTETSVQSDAIITRLMEQNGHCRLCAHATVGQFVRDGV